MIKVFVFVRGNQVEFMQMFFKDIAWSFRHMQFFVSGGDCNPIIYPEDKIQ